MGRDSPPFPSFVLGGWMGMESCSSSSLISACYPRVSGQPFVPFVHGNRAKEGGARYGGSADTLRFLRFPRSLSDFGPGRPGGSVGMGRDVGVGHGQATTVGSTEGHQTFAMPDDRVQVHGGRYPVLNSEPMPPLSAMTQATGHRQTKRTQRGSAASRPPLVDASSVTGPEPQRVHEPSPAVRAGCRTRGCDGGSGCRIFCPSIPRCHFKPWFKNRYLPGLPKACCAGSWQVQASGCRPLRPSPSNRDDDIWGVVGTSSPAWPPKTGGSRTQKREVAADLLCFPWPSSRALTSSLFFSHRGGKGKTLTTASPHVTGNIGG